MTVRLATLADAFALRTLFLAVKTELIADHGSVNDFTLVELKRLIKVGYVKVIVDDVPPVRGCNLFVRKPDGWESLLTMTDKTMTLMNRLASVRRMFVMACSSVPPETIFYGYVKTGGNFYSWLTTTFAGSPSLVLRDDPDGRTYFGGRVDEMLARL